jgi:hypothetical protein
VNRARHGTGFRRIHQPYTLRGLQLCKQCCRFAILLDDPHVGRHARPQRARNQPANSIVAAIRIADAEHQAFRHAPLPT